MPTITATSPEQTTLMNRLAAETIGTAFLMLAVVGSASAAADAFPADPGLVLAVTALATGAVLTALIVALGSVSAAFNPAVTIAQFCRRTHTPAHAAALVAAQVTGALAGVLSAHVMFGLPLIAVSSQDRFSGPVLFAEVVATFGLVLLIALSSRSGDPLRIGLTVGAYITAAIWFTSSTAFANPAVTIARTLTDTGTGIAPTAAPAFIAAQLAGAMLALGALHLIDPRTTRENP